MYHQTLRLLPLAATALLSPSTFAQSDATPEVAAAKAIVPLAPFAPHSVTAPGRALPLFRFLNPGGPAIPPNAGEPPLLEPTVGLVPSRDDWIRALHFLDPEAKWRLDPRIDAALGERADAAAALARWNRPQVAVEVAVWTGGKTPNATVLTAADWSDFRRSRAPIWRSTNYVARSALGQFHGLRQRPISRPNGMVAQGAELRTSRVGHMLSGFGVDVVAHPVPGSTELVLMAQVASTIPGSAQVTPRPVDGYPDTTSPSVTVTAGAMSGRIADGGALIWHAGGRGLGAQITITVAARWTSPPTDEIGDTTILPMSALWTTSLGAPAVITDYESAWGIAENAHSSARSEREQIAQWVRGTEGFETIGRTVFVRGSDSARGAALGRIRALTESALANTEVRLTGALGKGSESAYHVRFPALTGRHHPFSLGRQSQAVQGVLPYVAADAKLATPSYTMTHAGWSGSVLPWRDEAGIGATLGMLSTADWPSGEVTLMEARPPIATTAVQASPIQFHGPVDGTVDLGEGAANPRDASQRHTIRLTVEAIGG